MRERTRGRQLAAAAWTLAVILAGAEAQAQAHASEPAAAAPQASRHASGLENPAPVPPAASAGRDPDAAAGTADLPGEASPPEPFLLDGAAARPLAAEALLADPPRRFRVPPGEELLYEVRYLGVPLGHVRVRNARLLRVAGRRVAHVVVSADTNEVFSKLYPIHDRSEAWIDVDTGRTLQTATWVRHGRRKETYEETAFDRAARLVHVIEHKLHEERVREATLDTGPDIYDTFELVYAVRALPLAVGSRARLPVYAHFDVRSVEIETHRRETVQVDALGPVEALVLRPRVDAETEPTGSPGSGEIWLAADRRRIPLRVDGWFRSNEGFRVGGVAAELVAYTPGDPRWETLAWETRPARVAPPPLEDGRPLWQVPASVARARARLGLELKDHKHRGTTPGALLACHRLAAVAHFPTPPFAGAGPEAGAPPPRGCGSAALPARTPGGLADTGGDAPGEAEDAGHAPPASGSEPSGSS